MFSNFAETQTTPAFDFSTTSRRSNPEFPAPIKTMPSFIFGAPHEATRSSLPKKEPFTSSQVNKQSESFLTRIEHLETKVKELEEKTVSYGKHGKEELLAHFQNYMVAAFKLVNCLFSMAIAKIAKLRDTAKVHTS
tara:strand:+ start:958 stop:1365 length:408 start_codon:yes stop_codon:yes gene_type:complete